MIKHVNENKFNEEIKNKKVLVDFYATWCGPCMMLSSVLEKINNKGIIDIIKVDVDMENNLSNKYKIFSVPTIILFKNGVEIKRISGFMNEEELVSWVNNNEK